VLDDGKAEATATSLALARRIDAREAIEHTVAVEGSTRGDRSEATPSSMLSSRHRSAVSDVPSSCATSLVSAWRSACCSSNRHASVLKAAANAATSLGPVTRTR
jgi:hypothetical protein